MVRTQQYQIYLDHQSPPRPKRGGSIESYYSPDPSLLAHFTMASRRSDLSAQSSGQASPRGNKGAVPLLRVNYCCISSCILGSFPHSY